MPTQRYGTCRAKVKIKNKTKLKLNLHNSIGSHGNCSKYTRMHSFSCNNKAFRLIESDLWYWLMLFHQICCKFAVVPWNTINTSIFIFWNFITCFIDGRIEERRKGVAENIVCLFTARQILYRQPVVHLNYRMVTYVSCSS